MKKHAIVIHWLIDYLSYAQGTLQGYLHTTVPKQYLDSKTKKPPIILLPGLSERWGFIKHLGDFISHEGYPVYIIPKLGSNFKSVANSAKIVQQTINANNLRNIIIIGHSKGGTIGQYLLVHQNKDKRIKGVIAIATPFKGTLFCKLIPYKPYKELLPNAELIKNLQKNHQENHKIISIAPSWDNHIWPQRGSHLEGAENIQLKIKGHHRILFSKELLKTLLYSIEKLTKKQV